MPVSALALVIAGPWAAEAQVDEVARQIAALSSKSSYERQEAARKLGVAKDLRAVDPLIAALRDPEGEVRRDAADALGKIKDARSIAPLFSALGDKDAGGRALEALKSFGDAVVGPALKALSSASPGAYKRIAELLDRKDAQTVGPLLEAVANGRGDLRLRAALLLYDLSQQSSLQPLSAALESAEPSVRRVAAAALAELALRHGSAELARAAVDALAGALRDRDVLVRKAAAQALGRLGGAALGQLTVLVRDPDATVRGAAVDALTAMDVTSGPAFTRAPKSRVAELLKTALSDSDPVVAARARGAEGAPSRVAPPSPAARPATPSAEAPAARPELVLQSGHEWVMERTVTSPDGRLEASGGSDNAIRIWDRDSGYLVRQFNPRALGQVVLSDDWVTTIAFHPNRPWLASGHRNNAIRIFDIETGNEVRSFVVPKRAPTDSVQALGFANNGTLGSRHSVPHSDVFEEWGWVHFPETGLPSKNDSPAADRAIGEAWDRGAERRGAARSRGSAFTSLGMFRSKVSRVAALAVSRDGRWLVAGSGNRRSAGEASSTQDDGLRLWDLTAGQVARWVPMKDVTTLAAISPDGRLVAAGPYPLTIWDMSTWQALRSWQSGSVDASVLTFSADSRWLDTGSGQAAAVGGEQVRESLRGVPSPDGRLMVAGTSLRDAETGAWIGRVPDSDASARVFSPDGRLLALGSKPGQAKDHAVRVWDVLEGVLRHEFSGHAGPVTTVAFSADGRRLASGGWDRTVRVWDLETGSLLWTGSTHSDSVTSVAFTPNGRFLLSASDDGSIRFWDAASGREAVMVASLQGGMDWVAITPEGLFDGTPEGLRRLVAWRQGSAVFSLEIFFSEFYHPGLLADVLDGKAPKPQRALTQVDRRQPRVSLNLAEPSPAAPVATRTVTVKVGVQEAPGDPRQPAGSGVRDVRLFRNGTLVKAWRGELASGSTLEAPVTLQAGKNVLTAYAFNRDNIKSADARLEVEAASSLSRRGTAYILAVGINVYSNPSYNLKYGVADARAVADELKRQLTGLAAFERIEVKLLLDATATRAALLAALGQLAGAAPEDAVFVYFAGHGVARGARFHLIPHDLGYAGARATLDADGLQTILDHSLSDLDLEKAFEGIDVGRLFLVIDACNSGQALEADEKRRGPMNSKGLAQLAYEKGMYVLTAAQGYQAALEAARLGHGYLTFALVEEGLKAAAADHAPTDNLVSAREWLDYATQRVPQLQLTAMEGARTQNRELAFVEGEQDVKDLGRRQLQTPRAFYRREPEVEPFILAKPSKR